MPKTEPMPTGRTWGPITGRNETLFVGRTACFMPWSIMAPKPHVQMTFRALKQPGRTSFVCPLLVYFSSPPLPNEASLAHHCPVWFYIIAVLFFFSPPCAALFLESQYYLLLIYIYIIFFYRKQTFKKNHVLHSSGAFVGMFMSSCLKLQMPSNMHGTSENTLKKKNRV